MYEWEKFDWDDENIGHIARPGVEPWEAEDAILDPDRVGASARNVPGERRFAVVGSTEPGRMLFVVFTRRGYEWSRPETRTIAKNVATEGGDIRDAQEDEGDKQPGRYPGVRERK